MAAEKPVTTMIVGLGRIGWKHHIRAAAANPHFKVTAAVEPLPERRKEAEDTYGCATFATLKAALAAKLAELAVICTPSIGHCAETLACFKAGLHVFIEKPAAMSTAEFDKMIAASKRAKKILTVHQSLRMIDSTRFVHEILDSKILGRVFHIRTGGHQFYRRNDWQMSKAFGGGLLNNGGSHIVDSILQLLKSPVADVWGDLKHTVGAGDADDFVKIMIRSKSGVLVDIETTYGCAIPQPGWLVCGTCGTMVIDGEEAKIKYFDPKKAPKLKLITTAPGERRYGNDDTLPWQEKTVPAKPTKPFPDFYENLYKAIRKRGKLIVKPEEVRQALWVMDEVRRRSQWKY